MTATATDGAAYRVKTTRELLVERGQSSFAMRAEPQFTGPNEPVTFSIAPSGVRITASPCRAIVTIRRAAPRPSSLVL